MNTSSGEKKKKEGFIVPDDAMQSTVEKAYPKMNVNQNGANASPGGKKYAFDPNTDYTQKGIDAMNKGDTASAMLAERMHNAKDSALELGYGASGLWNYQDNSGLGGLKERKYNEIENYFSTPFSYDYRDDPEYQSIRKIKEKEAKKAYDDGYAALSTQFEGGVPVNMMNKLHETSADIVDSADNYIPTLKQLAYDMYMGQGNQLINQYGMLSDMERDQYNRWATDRDFMERGIRDTDDRRYRDQGYNEDVRRYNQGYNEDVRRYNQDYNEDVRRYEDDKAFRDKEYEDQQEWLKKQYNLDYYNTYYK